MKTTRVSLLERVRDRGDSMAWGEFHELYAGLIYDYARERGLNDTDATEIVGDLMEVLSRRMREFRYDRDRCKFRSWLKIIVRQKVVDYYRKKRPFAMDGHQLAEMQVDEQAPDEIWDRQWRAGADHENRQGL